MKAFRRMRQRRVIALVVALLVMGIGLLLWFGSHRKDAPTPGQAMPRQVEAPVAGIRTGNPPSLSSDTAPASPELKRCMDDLQDGMRHRTAALALRADARSQLAHALTVKFMVDPGLVTKGHEKQLTRALEQQAAVSRQAFARARALAPGDPAILWLSANQCGFGESCEAVQQELMRTQPDNAAVWLMAMGWARQRDDADAERAAFGRAVKSSRYDRHGGSAFMAVLDGYQGLQMPSTCAAADVQEQLQELMQWGKPVTALDWVLMQASMQEGATFPPYSGLWLKCRASEEAPLTAALREGCLQLGSRVAEGDTLREQIVGVRLMVELTAETSQGPRWRERYRNQRWMMEQPVTLQAQVTLTPEQIATGEVQAMQEVLQRRGRWPAPDGWLPPDAEGRSLIQTGRPPLPKKR